MFDRGQVTVGRMDNGALGLTFGKLGFKTKYRVGLDHKAQSLCLCGCKRQGALFAGMQAEATEKHETLSLSAGEINFFYVNNFYT